MTTLSGFNGSVLIKAPDEFSVDGKLSPIALIDFTVATTISPSSRLNGKFLSTGIGIKQN